MSTTTTATTVTTAKNTKFQLSDWATTLGITIVVVLSIVFATDILFNIGETKFGFWLGLLGPVAVASVFAVLWVTHGMEKKWIGFAIASAYVIVIFVVAMLVFALSGTLTFDQLGWGLLEAVLLSIALVLIKVRGLISRKLATVYPTI